MLNSGETLEAKLRPEVRSDQRSFLHYKTRGKGNLTQTSLRERERSKMIGLIRAPSPPRRAGQSKPHGILSLLPFPALKRCFAAKERERSERD